MLIRIFAVLGLCLPMQAQAQAKVSNFMLDNGMQVVVVEDHRKKGSRTRIVVLLGRLTIPTMCVFTPSF